MCFTESYKSVSAISEENFKFTAISINDFISSESGSESDENESVMSQHPSVKKPIPEDESAKFSVSSHSNKKFS